MPELTLEESLELSKIYSVSGRMPVGGLIRKRPFIAPHHSVTAAAMFAARCPQISEKSGCFGCFTKTSFTSSSKGGFWHSPESRRNAIHNAGILLPPKKITVNLSPADVRKEGTAFDLAIAVAILAASGYISMKSIENIMFVGELSLDGCLNPVSGILPTACCAGENGFKSLLL